MHLLQFLGHLRTAIHLPTSLNKDVERVQLYYILSQTCMKMAVSDLDRSLENLINTFNELNSTTVDELFSEPSPLEFMRYVAHNTPFVIRGGASSWKATKKWNAAYLKTALEGQFVNVAVTPFG